MYTIYMDEYFQPEKKLTIAVDFDGTIVTHKYPKIGRDIGAIPILRKIQENGHDIILYTMRSGEELWDAVRYLNDKGITLFGINRNHKQDSWTTSPKIYAHVYIDDAALGTPLLWDEDSKRPYVNWNSIEHLLIDRNII